MAGAFQPTIETGGGFTGPSNIPSGLEGAAIAVQGITGFASGVIDSFAASQRRGREGSTSEARLKREARERLSGELDAAVELQASGRNAEADNLLSNSISRFAASFDIEEVADLIELKTGKPTNFVTRTPQENEVLSIMNDPSFTEKALPTARGTLLQKGIDNPTSDQLVNEAVNIAYGMRIENAQIEQIKRGGEAAWLAGGQQAMVGRLNNKMSEFLGILAGAQAQGATATAEGITQAKILFSNEVAGIKSLVPPGTDTSVLDQVIKQHEQTLSLIESAPKSFIENANANVVAGLMQTASNSSEVVVLRALVESPELLTNFNLNSIIDLGTRLPEFKGNFTLPMFNSPSPETSGFDGPSAEINLFPEQAGGPRIEEIPPEGVRKSVEKSVHSFTAIDLSTPSGPEGASRLVATIGKLMGSQDSTARLKPSTVQSLITPNFIKQVNKLGEALPEQADLIKNQIAFGLSAQGRTWMERATGISRQSVFVVNPQTQQIEVGAAELRERTGGKLQVFLKGAQASYNGSVLEMIKDRGRKLDGPTFDQAFPLIKRFNDQFVQIDEFVTGSLWVNRTLETALKVTGTKTPTPVAQSGRASREDGPVRVNTQEEFDALPSGTTFIAPDGSLNRKN